MAKDALGHGSDPQGLGNGPDPRGLRSQIQIIGQRGFSGKKLGIPASSAGQALVNAVRGTGTVDIHPSMTYAMSAAGQKKFGPFASAIAGFREKYGPPANKGQLARIARFHKAVGRGE